jgi:ATP-dependent DNA helicase RecG
MTEEFLTLLEALERPLRFASRNDFANLSKVRDLEQLVDDLTLKALSLDLPASQTAVIQSLRESFAGYEKLQPGEKKRLIQGSLATIAGLKADKQSFPAAREAEEKVGVQSPAEETATAVTYPRKSPSTETPSDAAEEVREKTNLYDRDPSEIPIQYLKGVGPRVAALLGKKGIRSVEDALYYFPRRYEDRRSIKKISQLKPYTRETVVGEIVLVGKVRTKTRELFQAVVSDGTGTVALVWFKFNEKYLRVVYKKGATVILNGEVTLGYNDALQIVHPKPEDVEIIDGEDDLDKDFLNFNRIVPVYPLTEGMGQRRVRGIIKTVLDAYGSRVPDCIPYEVKQRRRLIGADEALSRVHFPGDLDRAINLYDSIAVYESAPHKTLSFYEFFLMELGLALKKRDVAGMPGIAFRPTGGLTEKLLGKLRFGLTSAQKRVLSEIENDMRAGSPMNRLLQGDVGSGKTIVALLSMLKTVECGYQAAIMAPTEILAEQHLRSTLGYVGKLGLRVVLLKSGLTKKEKDTYYEAIKSGEAQIAIGTHALLQEKVEFQNLGFVVIDEQHRFGVIQRAELRSKGNNPDVLVMTATPIPRTLAMTVYGDLDVSVLDEMPPGRKPIKTVAFYEEKNNRRNAYELVRKEIKKGRQAYVVYSLIEESENPEFKDLKHATQMAEELQNEIFPEFRVGLLHGRMKTEEKDEVMRRFIAHEIDILVSTTVIEVGVDVPNATVMVVENAERFGLSQLHQLRGRIGRGEHESVCVLISSWKRTEDAEARLSMMQKTSDGFRIAEADLMIRGPGDFLGTKQSGLPEFRFANLIRDARLLGEAREEAFRLVKDDPTLAGYSDLLREVLKRWGESLELAGVS